MGTKSGVVQKTMDGIQWAFDVSDKEKGALYFGILILGCYIVFSVINNQYLLAPGIYFFGVIVPAGLFLKAALLTESNQVRFISYLLLVATLVAGGLDLVRKVYW